MGVFLNADTQVTGKLKNLQRSNFQVSVVLEEPHSVAQSYPTLATLWTAACQASLSFTISWSLFKLMSIELMIPSKHLILCHPLLLPIFNLSQHQGLFRSVLCIRWPKHWSFSISPSNEYSGLISFIIDWLGLLAV